ncbi:MAG: hypothetical protein ACTSRF_04295 [Candidatus Freyarchaeota archaeon]
MVTVDVHVHPLVREIFERESELPSCVRRVFGFGVDPQPLETLLGEMDSSGIDRAVLLALDCRTSHNCFIPSNESVAELVERYPERFTGFASVDPRAATRSWLTLFMKRLKSWEFPCCSTPE